MSEKLDRILDYCDLLARAGSGKLTESVDVQRFERLRGQMSTQVPSLDERDPYTLLAEPLAASIVSGANVIRGELRNASAAGIALSLDEVPPTLGESVKVTVRDPHRGVEYTFGGTIVSRVVKGHYAMSLAFEGSPAKVRLGGRSGVFARGSISEIPAPATNSTTKRSNER